MARRLLIAGGVGLTAVGVALAWPPRTRQIRSNPRPATSFAEASDRFAAVAARDDATVAARDDATVVARDDATVVARDDATVVAACHSRLLDHGAATDSVVVLLHGMTNCPRQFMPFGEELHAAGHTVLIPRLPYNGLSDRRTTALRQLRATALAAYGDEAIDIAAGLGRRVTVLGLSAGGLVAAWVAQHRPEARRAIIAAPFLGIGRFPVAVQALVRNICLRVPNVMLDDPANVVARKPPDNYIREATRSIGELMLFGEAILRDARHRPPAAQEIVLIHNAADIVISHRLVALLVQRWRAQGGRVDQFDFPASDKLGHDIVDPLQADARVDLVYPVLRRFIDLA